MGSVIRMYGAIGGGAENGIAQVDIPMSGDLIGVQWNVTADMDADQEILSTQLSFRASGAFSTNDDRGIISQVGVQLNLTTSGASHANINNYVPLPDIPIAAGERLYLHSNSSAGNSGACTALLHFSFDIDKVSSRRR